MANVQDGDVTEIKLGICRVSYNSVDLGYTKGGCTLRIIPNQYEVTVDEYGSIPLKEYDMGYAVEVDVSLAQHSFDQIDAAVPVLTNADSGGSEKRTYGDTVGSEIVGKELVLDPVYSAAGYKVTIYKAVPVANFEVNYAVDAEKVVGITFKGTLDDTRDAGDQLFSIEDPAS